MRKFIIGLLFISLFAMMSSGADALVVRSWDDNNERGGDLLTSTGDFGYGAFRQDLLGAGHTILSGVSTLSAATLSGVNTFFWGTSSHSLSASEATALSNFVRSGGCLILEADTATGEYTAAQAALVALGLSASYTGSIGGANSNTAGTFQNVVSRTTVGPFGDLRGLSFGSTIIAGINPGSEGVVVGINSLNSLVEFIPYLGGGGVLATGDPYGFGLFMDSASIAGFYNPNNAEAYLNFMAAQEVPEPATMLLVGSGLAALGVFRRRFRKN